MNSLNESPAQPEFYQNEQHKTETTQKDSVSDQPGAVRREEIEVSFLIVESIEEDDEEYSNDNYNESSEEDRRVYSCSWWVSHDNRRDCVF